MHGEMNTENKDLTTKSTRDKQQNSYVVPRRTD